MGANESASCAWRFCHVLIWFKKYNFHLILVNYIKKVQDLYCCVQNVSTAKQISMQIIYEIHC